MQTPWPSIRLFKPFKAKPSLRTLKSLTITKWCRWTKHGWLFPYGKWYPCQLLVLLSKSISSRWIKHSKLAIERGTNFFYVSPLNWKGQEEFQYQHMYFWTQHWMFENEIFESFFLVDHDLKSISKHMFFYLGW